MKIAVIGNCQVRGIAQCLEVMAPTLEILGVHVGIDSSAPLEMVDVIVVQTEFRGLFEEGGTLAALRHKTILTCPTFYFPGLHPDLVYVKLAQGVAQSPLSDYQSSIIFHAWSKGLDVDQTEALFCEPVFEHLGFFNYWNTSKQALLADIASADLDMDDAFDHWAAKGAFAFSVNHPKLFVLGRIAAAILDRLGVVPVTRQADEFLQDQFRDSAIWPVYPEVARRLGMEGDYSFKVSRHVCTPERPVFVLGLRAFIEASLRYFDVYPREELRCDRLEAQGHLYRDIEEIAASAKRKGGNPYTKLPAFCFWRKGVSEPDWTEVDPVVRTRFKLAATDRIATAGSCFAQHIARTLVKNDYKYYVAEAAPPGMTEERAAAGSYGLFSARYGNVYTARQLLQLIDRAYGRFSPRDSAWTRRDGALIDPFRPQVEKDAFASLEALLEAREAHLEAVRRLFETTDVFVFTIGLTESWRAKSDGAVFPVAPGVVATGLDEGAYEFVNFGVDAIRADMRTFVGRLRAVNPAVRIVLTVSPVPLVATYERRHVLVSTTYSKSVLRVVADEIAAEFEGVDYFPSYEIITGNFSRGRYFEDDLREVRPEGVEHVMRLFKKHFYAEDAVAEVAPVAVPALDVELRAEISRGAKVICDEELLDVHR